MDKKVSVASRKEKLAEIDNMLLQLINEVEECRNTLKDKVNSYREAYFTHLHRDVFDVKK